MTLIDSALARKLGTSLNTIKPISVSGIGSRHTTMTYTLVTVSFRGVVDSCSCMGQVEIPTHLVDNLKAKLLIGNNVMIPHGFILNFDSRTVSIAGCHGLTFPVAIQAKPDRVERLPVYATTKVVIPPQSRARVPVRVRRELPDRDFVFKPKDPGQSKKPLAAFYTHLVDKGLSFVDCVNKSPQPVTIERKAHLGTLDKVDIANAYQVNPVAAELTRTVYPLKVSDATRNPRFPEKEPLVVRSHDVTMERVLPNGVTVYGPADVSQRLQQVVEEYPIWGERLGVVEIPEDE